MNNEASTALAVKPEQKTSALVAMATRLGADQDKLLNTLKATVFKNATNEELLALVVVANQYGLNPLTKELYAFPAKGGGIVPVVSVDGWMNLMNSHPQMDGIEFEWKEEPNGDPVSCTAIIYRKDRSRPTKVTEYFSECSRNTEPWKMKHRMLRHKAIIQGARVAFGFSGIYDEEEAQVIAGRVEQVASQPARPIFTLPDGTEDNIPMDVLPPEKPKKAKAAPAPETDAEHTDQIPQEETPAFTPDTPQKRFLAALAEREIKEKQALDFLEKEYGIKVKLLEELTDAQAEEALREVHLIGW
jgi:phage recombination protein Bet